MKIVCITAYTFPSKRAEPYHQKSLAEAFTAHARNDFLFVINGTIPPEFSNIPTLSVKAPKRARAIFYFFWFPRFVYAHKLSQSDTVVSSNDPYLLIAFIVWKRILRYKYRICADWHLLFDDWKDRFITRHCNYIITTTQRLKDVTVSRCGINPGKVLVAYGGIDESLLDVHRQDDVRKLRAQLQLPADAFLIGYAGTFRCMGLEKGLDTMLSALVHMPKQVHMVFVGGTKEEIKDYEQLARQLEVNERCLFFARQPFTKIMEYEQAMDILVIPYPDQHHFRDYGFPIKVWEYMATGRPIVYSDLDIIAEVLREKGTAFIPDDPISLARALTSIYDDPEQAMSISRKNIENVKQYTWSLKAGKILDFWGYATEKHTSTNI